MHSSDDGLALMSFLLRYAVFLQFHHPSPFLGLGCLHTSTRGGLRKSDSGTMHHYSHLLSYSVPKIKQD